VSDGGWDVGDTLVGGFPPPSTRVKVEFGSQSVCGRSRSVNEDNFLIIRLSRHQETLATSLPESLVAPRFDEQGYAMVVADGLGGAGKGDAASRLAVSTLMQLVLYFGKWNLRIDERIAREMMARAERFYRHIDATLAYEGIAGRAPGLQTTLTAVFGAGTDLFFAHVGHSRAYMFRDGELLGLTRDHTTGGTRRPRIGLAPLVNVNVAARDLKHILTDAIGMAGPSGPRIDLERVRLYDRDVVMVCTNGLTDVLDEGEIAGVLGSDRSSSEQCKLLVDRVKELGGEDDATVLIGRYHIPPGE
jgi:protein phosphatase